MGKADILRHNYRNKDMRLVVKSPITMRKRLMFTINYLTRKYEMQYSPIQIKKITLADGFTYVVRPRRKVA